MNVITIAHQEKAVAASTIVEDDRAIGKRHGFRELTQASYITSGNSAIIDIMSTPAHPF